MLREGSAADRQTDNTIISKIEEWALATTKLQLYKLLRIDRIARTLTCLSNAIAHV